MVRKTITIPEDLHQDIRDLALEGESFSAAICRLARTGAGRPAASWIGMADGDPGDSMRVEEIIGEILDRIRPEDYSRGDA